MTKLPDEYEFRLSFTAEHRGVPDCPELRYSCKGNTLNDIVGHFGMFLQGLGFAPESVGRVIVHDYFPSAGEN